RSFHHHDDQRRGRGAALGQSARQPLGQRRRQGAGRRRPSGLGDGDDEPRQSRARRRLAARRRQARREGRGAVQPAARRRAQSRSAEEAHRARDRRGLHRQHSRAGAAGARMSWRSVFRPAAALAIGALIGAPFALGQDPSGPPPKDTIFARKILMGAIDMNMDAIETMLAPHGNADAGGAQGPADPFLIMLMSFPTLFPAATNQWTAGADRAPATDPYASPALWANFVDFYRRAATASKLAQDASTAKRLDEFKRLI